MYEWECSGQCGAKGFCSSPDPYLPICAGCQFATMTIYIPSDGSLGGKAMVTQFTRATHTPKSFEVLGGIYSRHRHIQEEIA